MFPSSRFRDAGASAQELCELEAEFAELAPGAQASASEQYAAIARGDLADILRARRERDASKGQEGAKATEPATVLGVLTPPDAGHGEDPAEDDPADDAPIDEKR